MRIPRLHRKPELIPEIDGIVLTDGRLPTAREILAHHSPNKHYYVDGMEGVAMAFNEERVRKLAQLAEERLAKERAIGATALEQ